MDSRTANTISSMIYHECCKYSLEELCEIWNVKEEDFEEFMDAALNSFKEGKDENN